ncbi:52 kDa repressor of the inhibitor of the protein kinase-like [Oratosquilla oratoria]|uniref:52 kDa repressor of the inhibitor of the protein kinase-like n=1 Tax=Oratosquilla oratoria TaxID=337810 RepID=UPI003F761A34
MNTHGILEYHNHNQVLAENFIQYYEGKRQSVEEQLLSGSKVEAMAGRESLLPTLKTVFFFGTQGLALRGHRDSAPLSEERPNDKVGNFRAASRSSLDAGGQVLKKHIDTYARNVTYLSLNIQNKIICSTGKLVTDKLVAVGNQTDMFTVIADGTIDSSVKNQLVLLERYIDMKGNIHEVFLGFEEATDGTSKAILELIVYKLKEYGLDLSLLRGQVHDRCAVMKGDTNSA